MDFGSVVSDNGEVPPACRIDKLPPNYDFMLKKPAPIAPTTGRPTVSETTEQRFQRILSRAEFQPLKAVLDNLRVAVSLMYESIVATNCYQMFLSKVGYRMVVVKQLHEQDCYSRLGPQGGVRAVLPLHDTATYSTMVTLVNLDSSVTTTANAVDFYDGQLAAFKSQLMNQEGNAG
jgi:hypothetical protein